MKLNHSQESEATGEAAGDARLTSPALHRRYEDCTISSHYAKVSTPPKTLRLISSVNS